MSKDKWSVINLLFDHEVGQFVEQGQVYGLLVEMFAKDGWFVAWRLIHARRTKYVVLGGVRCEDLDEVETAVFRVKERVEECKCTLRKLGGSDPCKLWREVLEGGLWDGQEEEDVYRMKYWFGSASDWLKTWEVFNVEPGLVEERLTKEGFEGEDEMMEEKRRSDVWWTRTNEEMEKVYSRRVVLAQGDGVVIDGMEKGEEEEEEKEEKKEDGNGVRKMLKKRFGIKR